jgi:hypothetical protein
MLRDTVGVELIAPEKHFRWRGGRITRLEGFTDAVFAFAVTLLAQAHTPAAAAPPPDNTVRPA